MVTLRPSSSILVLTVVVSDSEPWLIATKLRKTNGQLFGPGRRQLDAVGTLSAELNYKDQVVTETVHVIRNQSSSLFSCKACFSLGLLTSNVGEVCSVDEEYPELFRVGNSYRCDVRGQGESRLSTHMYLYSQEHSISPS